MSKMSSIIMMRETHSFLINISVITTKIVREYKNFSIQFCSIFLQALYSLANILYILLINHMSQY